MNDFEDMYYKMFAAVTDAIEMLQKVQLEAEENYIKLSAKDEHKAVLKLFDNKEKKQ